MSLQQLQDQIEAAYPRPIRLEKTRRKREESLQEFLILFFTKWNKERATVFVDDHAVQTDTGGSEGRRRSLGDIFMICKYYYPKVSLEEVLAILYHQLPLHFTQGFRTSYCNTIHKRVWYYNETSPNGVWNPLKNDEWGNPYRYYLALFAPVPSEYEGPDEEDDDEPEICGGCEEELDDCTCDDGEYYD